MDWLMTLDVQDAYEQIKLGNYIVVDVREVNEFAMVRIPTALLHPLSGFDPAALPNDPKRPVLFHCAAGVRSAKAAEAYRAYTQNDRVAHIGGGINAWAAQGLPTIEADH